MNKTTKGALAAGAAAAVLLGGAGSLAFWTDQQSVTGGTITSGQLKLAAPTCTNWVYSGTTTTVVKFVPGDVVTKSCDFGITAQGDHLSAKVSAPSVASTSTNPTSSKATIATAYTLSGTGGASGPLADGGLITSADDTKTLNAKFTVTIPFGTNESGTPIVNGNDTQNWTLALSNITVTLTQQQGTTNPAS